MTLTTAQRHKLAEEVARKHRALLTWSGFGFVAALAVAFMAYERTTIPQGAAANAAFERLFDPAAMNRVYSLDGKVSTRRNLALAAEVRCSVHTDRRGDRSYDYDCVAMVRDVSNCHGFIPFYVETSSIGLISRPVSDATAAEILKRVQFSVISGCAL